MRKLWNKKSYVLIFVFAIVFLGCSGQPSVTQAQVNNMQTKILNSNYQKVYRGTLSAIQNLGYTIQNTDMKSGLIVANAEVVTSQTSQMMSRALAGRASNVSSTVDLNIIINKISSSKTKIRAQFRVIKYGENSRYSGVTKQSATNVYDPAVYKSLFSEISKEL